KLTPVSTGVPWCLPARQSLRQDNGGQTSPALWVTNRERLSAGRRSSMCPAKAVSHRSLRASPRPLLREFLPREGGKLLHVPSIWLHVSFGRTVALPTHFPTFESADSKRAAK